MLHHLIIVYLAVVAMATCSMSRRPLTFSGLIISHHAKLGSRKLELKNEKIEASEEIRFSYENQNSTCIGQDDPHCLYLSMALSISGSNDLVTVLLASNQAQLLRSTNFDIVECWLANFPHKDVFDELVTISHVSSSFTSKNFSPDEVNFAKSISQSLTSKLPLLIAKEACRSLNFRQLTKRQAANQNLTADENLPNLPKILPKTKPTLTASLNALLDMMGGRFIRTYFNDFVLPGTRWCGRGNQASSPMDLGEYTRSDLCCRQHDHCRYVLVAGENNWGMHNKESYTISHCNCDKIFHSCLTANRFDAASCLVWDTYFTMIKAPCFEFEEYRNGTKRATIRRKTYEAPDCSMHNVVKEIIRQVMGRLQGKWRRPGRWEGSDEEEEGANKR